MTLCPSLQAFSSNLSHLNLNGRIQADRDTMSNSGSIDARGAKHTECKKSFSSKFAD